MPNIGHRALVFKNKTKKSSLILNKEKFNKITLFGTREVITFKFC